MAQKLKIAAWNSNGFMHHIDEVKSFLFTNKIDIMLISETHFTKKHYIKIPHYIAHHTMHPDDTHGGTAILIKNNIRHNEAEKYKKDFLQATTIMDWAGLITIKIYE